MKKTLCFLFLIITSQIVISQVTFYNYLDSTVTWHSYNEGWDGVQSFNSYTTTYFDGDTLINGKYYYKEYRLSYDTTFSWTGINIVDTVISDPCFIREDSSNKFFYYSLSDSSENVFYNWFTYLNLQVNDTFPINGSNCLVEFIDSVNLGSRYLKRFHGNQNVSLPNYVLEGVGQIGPTCAVGIEGNGWIACFQKQNDLLQFSNLDCNSFPIPQRHCNFTTSINNNFLNNFILFPNPIDNLLQIIGTTGQSIKSVSMVSTSGKIVIDKVFNSSNITINVSTLPKGIYLVHIVGDNINEHRKVIKY